MHVLSNSRRTPRQNPCIEIRTDILSPRPELNRASSCFAVSKFPIGLTHLCSPADTQFLKDLHPGDWQGTLHGWRMPRQNSKCGDEGARQYEDARIRSSPPRNECRRRTSALLVTALLVAVFSIALYQLFHKMRTETALPLLFAASIANVGVASAFNNPPGVDIWCGKAYRPTCDP